MKILLSGWSDRANLRLAIEVNHFDGRKSHNLEGSAIHFGAFALCDDGEAEPVRELQEALGNQISNFWILEHGEEHYVE